MLKFLCTYIIVHMLYVCINACRCSHDYTLVLIWEICVAEMVLFCKVFHLELKPCCFNTCFVDILFSCMLMNGSKQSESKDGHLMVQKVGKVCGKVRSLDRWFCLEVQGAERLCQCKLQKVKI